MRVLVSVPTTGQIHKLVSAVLLKLQLDRRHKLRIIHPTHTPFENNLAHIVNDFMDGDEDFWLTIDADNPPMRNPLDLVEHDLDIVGCPTPVWHWKGDAGERPIYFNAYRYMPEKGGYTEWRPQEGLQCVDAVGTGCVLFARRVFENPAMREAPFQRIWNHDGTVERGNDIAFCERARAAGFRVWADFDYPCHHFVNVDLCEVLRAFHGLGVK